MLSNIVKSGALMALLSTLAVAVPVADKALVARASAPDCNDGSFVKAALASFNEHRAAHDAPPFEWDPELAKYAQGVADKCVLVHSNGNYGEDLYGQTNIPTDYAKATSDAIFSLTKEIWNYDFSNPGFSEATGHATAILWKGTKKVGAAWSSVTCPDGGKMFVVEFADSVPNMEGAYAQNVKPYHAN